jgi:SHS2 domain-containing protein
MTTRAGDPTWSAREIEHTADVGFEIEAPGWEPLLERGGLAVAALIVSLDGVTSRETRVIDVTAGTREELMHDWLQEVLVRVQAGFVPCEIAVRATQTAAAATLRGEALDLTRHRVHGELKGVTWHGLAVEEIPAGLRARVILDV